MMPPKKLYNINIIIIINCPDTLAYIRTIRQLYCYSIINSSMSITVIAVQRGTSFVTNAGGRDNDSKRDTPALNISTDSNSIMHMWVCLAYGGRITTGCVFKMCAIIINIKIN